MVVVHMRILMLTPSFHPAIGGVETHVRRVSEQLAARGHQVEIVTHADHPSEEQLGPLRVYRLPRQGWWRAWQSARPHLAAADIVHCHDTYSYLHFYVPSWVLPPRRPVFMTFHGYESFPIPTEAIRRRRFVRGRVRDALCAGDFICRWYGTRCFGVTYGGTDPVGEAPPLPAPPAAVFVGRLAEDTSLLVYLDALATLRREHERTLPLTVVGDGPLRPVAERFAQAQRLAVRFLGTVADPREHYARASVAFVSGYLAIWQALAMRRLVFAVYENELKRDYLLGFPEAERVLSVSPDAASLAEALLAHLEEPAMGEERREQGAALAAAHTWDRVADLYLDMYRAHGMS
jgi:glycosyltransferase involved in cell wall biosynthesis